MRDDELGIRRALFLLWFLLLLSSRYDFHWCAREHSLLCVACQLSHAAHRFRIKININVRIRRWRFDICLCIICTLTAHIAIDFEKPHSFSLHSFIIVFSTCRLDVSWAFLLFRYILSIGVDFVLCCSVERRCGKRQIDAHEELRIRS